MSCVTSIIVTSHYFTRGEEQGIASLDLGNGSRPFPQPLVITNFSNLSTGGSKIPEIDMALGGINYAATNDVIISLFKGILIDAVLIIYREDDILPEIVVFDNKNNTTVIQQAVNNFD